MAVSQRQLGNIAVESNGYKSRFAKMFKMFYIEMRLRTITRALRMLLRNTINKLKKNHFFDDSDAIGYNWHTLVQGHGFDAQNKSDLCYAKHKLL